MRSKFLLICCGGKIKALLCIVFYAVFRKDVLRVIGEFLLRPKNFEGVFRKKVISKNLKSGFCECTRDDGYYGFCPFRSISLRKRHLQNEMKFKPKNNINLGGRVLEVNNVDNLKFIIDQLLRANIDRDFKRWLKVWKKLLRRRTARAVIRMDIFPDTISDRVIKDEEEIFTEVKPEPR